MFVKVFITYKFCDVHPRFAQNHFTIEIEILHCQWLYHFFINKTIAITTDERLFLSRGI